jgi:hypothetical protein
MINAINYYLTSPTFWTGYLTGALVTAGIYVIAYLVNHLEINFKN